MLSTGSIAFLRAFRLVSSCYYIPHPEKAATGGEDAHFIDQNGHAVGVADGVGGWQRVPGGNAAKYSRDLMKFCLENSHLSSSLDILTKAHESMDKTLKGSSTATVAVLNDDELEVLNVGDSAAALFSEGDRKYQSIDTVHGFNFPYQLGMGSQTTPKDGTIDKIKIKKGDILLLGTDGLWDNIFSDDILRVVKENGKYDSPKEIAEKISVKLAKMANENGSNSTFMSPFAVEAKKAGYYYVGGKLDDVTVLASVVV